MKVVIACLNSKFVHASLAPWCLLAGVRAFAQTPCDAVVEESTINGDTAAFAGEILSHHPDVVALSCYIWNMQKTLELCRLIRRQSDCTVVLGGPEVAYCPREILKMHPFVDYVLSGEGEWTFPSLLDNLGDPASVAGLTYRQNGAICVNPEPVCKDTPPSPYCDEFFAQLRGRIAYIETTRGCPYRCAFCLSGRCSPLRAFDLDGVKRDLLRLAASGTQTVKFVDRTFNADAARANEILLFIQEHYGREIPRGVCFHFEIAGDILKDSTLDVLSSMPHGAVQLEIGLQSFNEEVLLAVNRKTNTKKLLQNIRKLLSFQNMHIHIDLIAGLTGEDFESFKRGFNLAYALKAHMLQMGFLKLLHGADMRENPQKYPCTFHEEPPYEVISTPCLSAEEICTLKRCEDALDRLYNSGRFLLSLSYLIDEVGFDPFDLFFEFGNAVDGGGLSLTEYVSAFYAFFEARCDAAVLREMLVCDLLCAASSTQTPVEFRQQGTLYKRVKAHFAQQKNAPVKVALLPTKGQVCVVDPTAPRDLHNRFEAAFFDLADVQRTLDGKNG